MWNLLRSLVYAALFVSLWTYFVPAWIVGKPDWSVDFANLGGIQIFGIALMLVGGFIAFSCVIDFGTAGKGTPAPFDPPRKLVRHRFYRHVRNPMYLGMAVLLTGEALLFPAERTAIFVMLIFLIGIVNLFVLFYEEPTLRREFGEDYFQYCRHVPRWLPRLRPYTGLFRSL